MIRWALVVCGGAVLAVQVAVYSVTGTMDSPLIAAGMAVVVTGVCWPLPTPRAMTPELTLAEWAIDQARRDFIDDRISAEQLERQIHKALRARDANVPLSMAQWMIGPTR